MKNDMLDFNFILINFYFRFRYEPGRRDLSECRYNQNEGYVIFSAMGSFFIPMAVMIYVYARISCVVASRHDNMTDISVHNQKVCNASDEIYISYKIV